MNSKIVLSWHRRLAHAVLVAPVIVDIAILPIPNLNDMNSVNVGVLHPVHDQSHQSLFAVMTFLRKGLCKLPENFESVHHQVL